MVARSKLPDLLDRREAAAAVRISLRLLDALPARGELGSIRIGGGRLIPVAEITAFLLRGAVPRICPPPQAEEAVR